MTDQTRPGSLTSRLGATTRLLVVEDDADIADFLRAYFRASGYDVVHVDPASIDEAFESVRTTRPDCVLLDLWLNGFNGLQLFRRIRSHDELDTVPVIMVTADVAARGRADPMLTGIDGFVTKPFAAADLASVVAGRITAARDLAARGAVDPTSGALSAEALDARIATELELARTVGEPLAVALVAVRPERGLGSDGEAWLTRRVVEVLQPALPVDAVVGRTEGAEVAVLLPGTSAGDAAPLLDAALADARRDQQLPGGRSARLDPVAGVASWPEHASDPAGLFMAADAALAEAAEGASGVVVVAR